MSTTTLNITLKSRSLSKEAFSIQDQCVGILSRKPRVSRNVLQAYYREILDIAKASKQVFLDIAERKEELFMLENSDARRYLSLVLQLVGEVQVEKTEMETHWDSLSQSVEALQEEVSTVAVSSGVNDREKRRERI